MSLTMEDFKFIEGKIHEQFEKAFADTPERRERMKIKTQIWTELFGNHRPASVGEAFSMGYAVNAEYERRYRPSTPTVRKEE